MRARSKSLKPPSASCDFVRWTQPVAFRSTTCDRAFCAPTPLHCAQCSTRRQTHRDDETRCIAHEERAAISQDQCFGTYGFISRGYQAARPPPEIRRRGGRPPKKAPSRPRAHRQPRLSEPEAGCATDRGTAATLAVLLSLRAWGLPASVRRRGAGARDHGATGTRTRNRGVRRPNRDGTFKLPCELTGS